MVSHYFHLSIFGKHEQKRKVRFSYSLFVHLHILRRVNVVLVNFKTIFEEEKDQECSIYTRKDNLGAWEKEIKHMYPKLCYTSIVKMT